ncbi:MAG: PEP-CTERM sorting domain-containing protein [Alphaproteobacteria bacterium]
MFITAERFGAVGNETSVPEPGTVGLLLVGLAGVGVAARRRGRR